MATRATIALEFADGTVQEIYSHWDGYISGVGSILLEHYKTPQSVAELLAQGDLSSLGVNLDETVFYARDRGETGVSARRYDSYKEYLQNADFQGYDYIMREGVWYVNRSGLVKNLIEAFRVEERL